MEAPATNTLHSPTTPGDLAGGMQRLELDVNGSVLYYYPKFLSQGEATHYFTALQSSIPWRNQDDSWEHQPRKVAWFSDSGATLTYSKVKLNSNPWIPSLLELKERILKLPEVASYHAHTKIDSCLANLYENGDNFIGYHSDTATMWGPKPLIASLTLGSTRRFILVKKSAAKEKGAASNVTEAEDRHEIDLPGGSLLLMTGSSQELWLHGVLRQPEITTARINLTFRNFLRTAPNA